MELVKQIQEVEKTIYLEWTQKISSEIHLSTLKYLLIRTELNSLRLNFDEKVKFCEPCHVYF